MGTPGDIEIQIFTRSLKERFLISPNELHRGDDAWAGLQMDERCMLSALLTMSSGYRTTRKRIDRIAAPQKSSVVDRILKNLRARRFLRQTRVNGAGGRFVWRWEVFMYPYDPEQPTDVSAGQTMGGNSGDGESGPDDADVSAGHTMGGFSMDGSTVDGESTDGSTVDGSPVDGESGDIRRTRDLEVPGVRGTSGEKNPPYPRAPSDADGTVPVEPEGGNPFSETDRATLNAAVAYTADRRKGCPGWSTSQVAAAIREQLDAGHTPTAVAAAVRQAADDKAGTAFPGRIGYLLTTARPAPASTATPSWVEGPFKYLDRDAPKCRKHRGQPADRCGGCRADEVAADRDQGDSGPTLDAQTAARAARERIAAGRRNMAARNNARTGGGVDALAALLAAAGNPQDRPAIDRPVDDLEVPAQRTADDLAGVR